MMKHFQLLISDFAEAEEWPMKTTAVFWSEQGKIFQNFLLMPSIHQQYLGKVYILKKIVCVNLYF